MRFAVPKFKQDIEPNNGNSYINTANIKYVNVTKQNEKNNNRKRNYSMPKDASAVFNISPQRSLETELQSIKITMDKQLFNKIPFLLQSVNFSIFS